MIPSKVMAKLATLGLSEEQAIAVASMLTDVEEATAAQGEVGKEKARARWRKWKEGHSTNVDKRLQTTANASKPLVHVEEKLLTTDIEPQESKKVSAPTKPSPRQRLESVLDADHAEAVLEHRQRLRKPLTERAAKMLAGDLAKFPDPNAAADRMIGKGWLTIEADWHGAQQRAGPLPKPNPALAAADALMEKLNATASETEGNQAYPRLVAFSGGG